MKKYKATDIANWFIYKFAESGDPITHLKVQKLLYYAEAWHQVINNSELIEGEFQAWAHGPVVPEVFQSFRKHGWNTLPIPDKSELPKISSSAENILEQVLDSYGELPAKTLENMTHKDEPWIKARHGFEPEERCENIMPKSEIKNFFKHKYNM